MTNTTKFDLILERVAARLTATAPFNGVTVVSYKSGDLSAMLTSRLGTLGVVVLVSMPQAKIASYPTVTPYYDDVLVGLEIVENVALNQSVKGTGMSALALAERAVPLLQGWTPLGEDSTNAQFLLRLDPAGIRQLTTATYLDQSSTVQQIKTLAYALNMSSDSNSLTTGGAYSVVSLRFLTQCFTESPAILSRLIEDLDVRYQQRPKSNVTLPSLPRLVEGVRTSLTGDSSSLDAVDTTDIPTGSDIFVTAGGQDLTYSLRPISAPWLGLRDYPVQGELLVMPQSFDAETNARVWVLMASNASAAPSA